MLGLMVCEYGLCVSIVKNGKSLLSPFIILVVDFDCMVYVTKVHHTNEMRDYRCTQPISLFCDLHLCVS